MKKIVLIVAALLIVTGVDAEAQERWMMGAAGSLPLGEYAPVFCVGVEGSFYALKSGPFRFGPGVGLLLGEYKYSNPRFSDARLKMPIYGRGEYEWNLGMVRPFVLLDVGGMITLAPANVGKKEKIGEDFANYRPSFFFTPSVGIDVGRHFFVAAGVLCQQLRYRNDLAPSRLSASASLKLGVRF